MGSDDLWRCIANINHLMTVYFFFVTFLAFLLFAAGQAEKEVHALQSSAPVLFLQ